jgi:hypothetical protein
MLQAVICVMPDEKTARYWPLAQCELRSEHGRDRPVAVILLRLLMRSVGKVSRADLQPPTGVREIMPTLLRRTPIAPDDNTRLKKCHWFHA